MYRSRTHGGFCYAALCATGSVTQRPPRCRVTNCSGMALSTGSASSAGRPQGARRRSIVGRRQAARRRRCRRPGKAKLCCLVHLQPVLQVQPCKIAPAGPGTTTLTSLDLAVVISVPLSEARGR